MTVGTSIYLAGGEVPTLHRALLDNGVRNVLFSFFYVLTMRLEQEIEKAILAHPDVNWFLDSGAFTYMRKYQDEPGKLPPLKQYLRRYFQYIQKYGHYYCRITEPDMDIAGRTLDEVNEWREEMLSMFPQLNVTPVYHGSRGVDEWYRYLEDKRIKTLAVGSDTGGDLGYMRRLVMAAAEYGKPVHGFGCTRINTTLRHVPYDSVDSTSWVMGQKAGVTYIFRNNKFRVLPQDKKHNRRLYFKYFRNIGCDPRKVIEDDVAEVRKANIIAWRTLSGRFEALKMRGRQTWGVNHTSTATPSLFRNDDGMPDRRVELVSREERAVRYSVGVRDGRGPEPVQLRAREPKSEKRQDRSPKHHPKERDA